MSEAPKKRGRKASPESKRQRGEDRHKGVRTVLYIDEDLAARLDGFVRGFRPKTTKAAVIRDALVTYLDATAPSG